MKGSRSTRVTPLPNGELCRTTTCGVRTDHWISNSLGTPREFGKHHHRRNADASLPLFPLPLLRELEQAG